MRYVNLLDNDFHYHLIDFICKTSSYSVIVSTYLYIYFLIDINHSKILAEDKCPVSDLFACVKTNRYCYCKLKTQVLYLCKLIMTQIIFK